jgi:hypothetical protein
MLVDGGLESARPWEFNLTEIQLKLLILNGQISGGQRRYRILVRERECERYIHQKWA